MSEARAESILDPGRFSQSSLASTVEGQKPRGTAVCQSLAPRQARVIGNSKKHATTMQRKSRPMISGSLCRWPPPPLRPDLKSKALWDSKYTWTVGRHNVSSSEIRGQLAIQLRLAPSRMITRSTRPDAEGSSREARLGLEQKLDQILATLAEVNRMAKIAHETLLGLKDEVAEVRRDNAYLEGLLASKARSGRREDFDKEVQQESGGQSAREVPAPSRSQMQVERQRQIRPFRP
ncbi:hypothetical protein PanWU01x14_322450 [Parasponia andersonii]|uniref:Uncharacterized protein n=1 Tax=Parasponia andersonii TaxID=3476 RepID=A0A2P5AKX8_PARAD|nr:hypothetical protein PanWU01x14_322450 [Parasponia andersonii]